MTGVQEKIVNPIVFSARFWYVVGVSTCRIIQL